MRGIASAVILSTLFAAPLSAQEPAGDDADPAAESRAWYPRTITGERGSAVIYAPQIDSWDDFEKITAWTAFSITRAGSGTSYYGTLRFIAQTDTDIANREVLLHSIRILDLSIDGLAEDSTEYELIRDGFTAMSRTVPLDLVLAYLPRNVALTSVAGLNTEPPTIFVSDRPAILLFVDGDPRFLPVAGAELQFVLNTTWDVLRDGERGPLYLCYDKHWLTSNALDGKWAWAKKLPEAFKTIPETPNWTGLHDCLPENLGKLERPGTDAPAVFYATEAAELLLTNGAPAWSAIGNEGLAFANNTEQDLFRFDDAYFLLLSGRWFTAESLDGPWTMAGKLPAVFQAIPPGDAHAKSHVRSSIAGTAEAWEAALIASIPRKADILRGSEDALNVEVNYAGEPVFAPIEDTGIDLAVNTSYQVLRYADTYYLCYNATWLTGSSATGPWQFADAIPDRFASIPPSSPAYNTTFVKVEGSDDDNIYYAYTSGYEGAYVTEETVVQGTGYAAPAVTMAFVYSYYGGYPYYPYYWWPPTYGYGSWYNPDTGRYGRSVVGYGPYGAAGGAAVYNPETGVYGRGQAVWDSDEFAGRGYAYNPNTDTGIARNRYVDFDDNEGWSQGVARRGDEWRYRQSEWDDGRMVTDFESSRGTEGTVVREREGDSIVSEGTVTGENRSATFEGVMEDGSYTGTIAGSEGGTGNVDRQLENGEISGGGTFTKDGNTIDSDVTRTAEGVQRDFETSGGGQGTSVRSGDDNAFVYESGSGDIYAGRDGNVYQKTDDGWASVENPGSPGASRAETSAAGVEARNSGVSATAQTSGGRPQYESSQAGSRNTASYSQLDRDFQSRQAGFDRYSQTNRSRGGRRRR